MKKNLILIAVIIACALSSFGQTVTKAVLANLDTLVTTTTVKYDTLHYKQPIPGGVISPSATYSNQSNITISGKTFNGSTLSFSNCSNVHITWCRFNGGTGTNLYAINFYNCTNVTVDYCYGTMYCKFVMVKGGSGIKVNNNQFKDLYEPALYGNDFAHAIQFNGVSGAGNQINNNRIEITSASVHPHDIIDIYGSSGKIGDSIQVIGNFIRNGQITPWPNSGATGCGIACGDASGSYQVIRNNILISTGCAGIQCIQQGIGIVSSIKIDHNIIYNNLMYQTAADGIVVLGTVSNIPVNYNRVYWVNKYGHVGIYSGGETSFWGGGSFPPTGVTMIGNKWFDTTLNSSILPQSLITWQ